MELENNQPIRSRADAVWKDVLEEFFEETIAFSFPFLYSEIDWSRPWDFLDKELQVITQESVDGTRFVDKLIRVFLKSGLEKWLLIHIEVQGATDPDFSKRMFIYHYRSFDKFGRHPVSCAILTDASPAWKPDSYRNEQLGCKLSLEFPILKLLDLEKQREDLENSHNPFACIIITQLNALKYKRKPASDRYQLKLSQTKRLYQKGFSGHTIRKLYHFIDGLIRLPVDFEIQFREDVFKFEESKQMAYVSTIEQFGIEKGIQQGMQQGLGQVAVRMLSQNFSIEMIANLTGLSQADVQMLAKQTENIF